MIEDLINIIPKIPFLLEDPNNWNTLLINKYEPIIHRLSYKISNEKTLFLHRLFETKHALMHSHSWPFACKLIEGEQEMGIGFSNNRDIVPESICTTLIKSGSVYEMLSPNIWHYTKPMNNCKITYSILLIGERYRERKALNNDQLSSIDKKSLIDYFKKKLQNE